MKFNLLISVIMVGALVLLAGCEDKLYPLRLDSETDENIIQLRWGLASGDLGTITVSVGDTVRFVRVDDMPHNVTSLQGNFQSSEILYGAGETYEVTFEQPGSYGFYCSVHPGMKGTILVSAQ
ncbi:MAG: cupredoxin domain-containing protein [Deltaproteobacteria bacterium]|nr:cupredoxin domain-containing protein [Deltaproteobacteria bacterium]